MGWNPFPGLPGRADAVSEECMGCGWMQLARDAQYHHAGTMEEEGRADVVILASRLSSSGLAVTLRTAVGGRAAALLTAHHALAAAGSPSVAFGFLCC